MKYEWAVARCFVLKRLMRDILQANGRVANRAAYDRALDEMATLASLALNGAEISIDEAGQIYHVLLHEGHKFTFSKDCQVSLGEEIIPLHGKQI